MLLSPEPVDSNTTCPIGLCPVATVGIGGLGVVADSDLTGVDGDELSDNGTDYWIPNSVKDNFFSRDGTEGGHYRTRRTLISAGKALFSRSARRSQTLACSLRRSKVGLRPSGFRAEGKLGCLCRDEGCRNNGLIVVFIQVAWVCATDDPQDGSQGIVVGNIASAEVPPVEPGAESAAVTSRLRSSVLRRRAVG